MSRITHFLNQTRNRKLFELFQNALRHQLCCFCRHQQKFLPKTTDDRRAKIWQELRNGVRRTSWRHLTVFDLVTRPLDSRWSDISHEASRKVHKRGHFTDYFNYAKSRLPKAFLKLRQIPSQKTRIKLEFLNEEGLKKLDGNAKYNIKTASFDAPFAHAYTMLPRSAINRGLQSD